MQLLVVFLLCLVVSSAIYWTVTHFWLWLLVIGGLLLAVRLVWPMVRHRWELHQVRSQRARAMRRLDDIHQQALSDVDEVVRRHDQAGGEPPSLTGK